MYLEIIVHQITAVATKRGAGTETCEAPRDLYLKVCMYVYISICIIHSLTHSLVLYSGGVKVDSFIYSSLLPSSSRGTVYPGIMHVSDWFPTILELSDSTYEPSSGLESTLTPT